MSESLTRANGEQARVETTEYAERISEGINQPPSMAKLRWIMSELRDPKTGCPWDLKQTFATIVPHTLEEAYEVADAIEQGDFSELEKELGDLLFQVVFYSQLGQEQKRFDFDSVVAAICEKLIRRHPHVFASEAFADEAAVKNNWENEKAKERASKHQNGQQPRTKLECLSGYSQELTGFISS